MTVLHISSEIYGVKQQNNWKNEYEGKLKQSPTFLTEEAISSEMLRPF